MRREKIHDTILELSIETEKRKNTELNFSKIHIHIITIRFENIFRMKKLWNVFILRLRLKQCKSSKDLFSNKFFQECGAFAYTA